MREINSNRFHLNNIISSGEYYYIRNYKFIRLPILIQKQNTAAHVNEVTYHIFRAQTVIKQADFPCGASTSKSAVFQPFKIETLSYSIGQISVKNLRPRALHLYLFSLCSNHLVSILPAEQTTLINITLNLSSALKSSRCYIYCGTFSH